MFVINCSTVLFEHLTGTGTERTHPTLFIYFNRLNWRDEWRRRGNIREVFSVLFNIKNREVISTLTGWQLWQTTVAWLIMVWKHFTLDELFWHFTFKNISLAPKSMWICYFFSFALQLGNRCECSAFSELGPPESLDEVIEGGGMDDDPKLFVNKTESVWFYVECSAIFGAVLVNSKSERRKEKKLYSWHLYFMASIFNFGPKELRLPLHLNRFIFKTEKKLAI